MTSVPARTTRDVNSGAGVADLVELGLVAQYRRFGSRKTTGSSQAMACWIIQ